MSALQSQGVRRLDPQALTQHVDRLYRAAWALCGKKEDAEDLVQETFARVLARPRMIRGEDELYYLMRALRNTFYTTRRTAARRPVTGAELQDVIAADPRPTGRPEQAIEVSELYGAIARLPEDFRLALVAVDVLGLSYRETARALKVREATITTRLYRARGQVARALEPGEPAAARTMVEARGKAKAAKAEAQTGAMAEAEEDAGRGEGHVRREEQDSWEETRARGVLESRGTP